MSSIDAIDSELYCALHKLNLRDDLNKVWEKIKANQNVLREAIEVTKDKFKQRDAVKAIVISHFILVDYDSIDKEVYNKLINEIYSNVDIARLVAVGALNGGYSFLLMSLWNHNLVLSSEQKAFAVNEAMYKIGTTRWKKQKEEYSQKLDEMGISDDDTTYINYGGVINPIGEKTGSEFMHSMFSSLSNTQAHGTGEFDIRYQILRNPNWSVEEKKQLVKEFYAEDREYDDTLEQWELSILNDISSNNGNDFYFDMYDLYDFTYEELLRVCVDKNFTKRIWDEIQFCKMMRSLRPTQVELEFSIKKKVI